MRVALWLECIDGFVELTWFVHPLSLFSDATFVVFLAHVEGAVRILLSCIRIVWLLQEQLY